MAFAGAPLIVIGVYFQVLAVVKALSVLLLPETVAPHKEPPAMKRAANANHE